VTTDLWSAHRVSDTAVGWGKMAPKVVAMGMDNLRGKMRGVRGTSFLE
jgi:hypothetical protein